MKNQEKEHLYTQTQKRYLWLRFKNGCTSLKNSKLKRLTLLVFGIIVLLIWIFNKERFRLDQMQMVSPAFITLSKLIFPVALITGELFIIILFGTPCGCKSVTDNFRRIGLTNSAGETPVLVAKYKDKKQSEATVLEFDSVGIPPKEWEDKQQRIETALNVYIVKIQEGKDKRTIRLYTVPASGGLSDKNEWRDSYLIKDSSTLVLGRSLLGIVTVDLAKIPHILLGGSTGSGKTVLLKTLLMQAVRKGAVVAIADFKGGVDFPPVWHERIVKLNEN